jgi:hypothetical protein
VRPQAKQSAQVVYTHPSVTGPPKSDALPSGALYLLDGEPFSPLSPVDSYHLLTVGSPLFVVSATELLNYDWSELLGAGQVHLEHELHNRLLPGVPGTQCLAVLTEFTPALGIFSC